MAAKFSVMMRNVLLQSGEEYTDRDLLALTELGNVNSLRSRREREIEAVESLEAIFPSINQDLPGWVNADRNRVLLNTFELVLVIAQMSGALQENPAFLEGAKASERLQEESATEALVVGTVNAIVQDTERNRDQEQLLELMRQAEELKMKISSSTAGQEFGK